LSEDLRRSKAEQDGSRQMNTVIRDGNKVLRDKAERQHDVQELLHDKAKREHDKKEALRDLQRGDIGGAIRKLNRSSPRQRGLNNL
jgi:hypothetical protein